MDPLHLLEAILSLSLCENQEAVFLPADADGSLALADHHRVLSFTSEEEIVSGIAAQCVVRCVPQQGACSRRSR